MTTPYLGQSITADTVGITLDEQYIIVRLSSDGTRRITDAQFIELNPTYPTWEGIRDARLRVWDYSPIVFWGPNGNGVLLNYIRYRSVGDYLPYPPEDGLAISPVSDPVNQVPYLQLFKGHAARFMHQLDATIGHHSLQAAEEDDRDAIRQTIRDMIGAAWIKYQMWAVIDPEELIVGGVNDGVPLWLHGLPAEQDRDRRICGQCNFSNFARLCLTDMNIPLFRTYLRSGIVYSVDISTRPKWQPAIFDVATNPRSQYYDMIEAGALAARRYYDTVVGVLDLGG